MIGARLGAWCAGKEFVVWVCLWGRGRLGVPIGEVSPSVSPTPAKDSHDVGFWFWFVL